MLTILAAMTAAQAEVPAMPAWMAGCWVQQSGDRWTEECWTGVRGGMMMGSSRSGSGDRLDEWEWMQIRLAARSDAAAARLSFEAAPRGENRTLFTWVPTREGGLTFVNLAHDYPQRIRYWREGRDLLAEISLADGSKARRWRYAPAR